MAGPSVPGPRYLIPGMLREIFRKITENSEALSSEWPLSGGFFSLSPLNPITEFFCFVRELSRRGVEQITIQAAIMFDGPERAHRHFEAHRPQRFAEQGHFVDVGQVAAPGLVVSMAHIVAGQNPFTCNVAPSRHSFTTFFDQTTPYWAPCLLRAGARSVFKTATLPRQGLFAPL